ncbi:MAG: hypothetical protein CM1200mP41_20680 [Gammaproteobacteria bacterium]|nr:MAG: hypothetical protein CM1200mP41_20680 [Gammaproteobacteria bacterium]
MLDNLRAVHRFEGFKTSADGASIKEFEARVKERLLVSEHPLVTIHPETASAYFTVARVI